jgi:Caspase domain
MSPILIDRRAALGMIGASTLVPYVLPWLPSGAAAATNDTVKVLYRKESETAPHRTEPVVEAAIRAIEDEFLKNGFRVLQPSAEAYRFLDRGPTVTVTFAADAGFSMLMSLSSTVRPRPGSDTGFVDVQLRARVFVGPNVLSVDQGFGSVMINLADGTREIAERKGAEEAAGKAALLLVFAVTKRLREIDPAKLAEMSKVGPIKDIYDTLPAAAPVVAPPASAASGALVSHAAVPVPPALAVIASNEPLPSPNKRFALIVTVSNYAAVRQRAGLKSDELIDLPGVAKDKVNLVDTLRRVGFPAEKIITLSDEEATTRNVMAVLSAFQGEAHEDDLVLVAISAHGASKDATLSGFGMPILADFNPKGRAGLLDFWTLQSMIGNMRARRTVMLIDTCHSGGAAQDMNRGTVVTAEGVSLQTNPQDANVMASAMGIGRHFAVIAAARADQSSIDTSNGGLFILSMMDALRTSAQQPLQRIFKEQVEKQVSAKAAQTGKSQNPVFASRGLGAMIRLQ